MHDTWRLEGVNTARVAVEGTNTALWIPDKNAPLAPGDAPYHPSHACWGTPGAFLAKLLSDARPDLYNHSLPISAGCAAPQHVSNHLGINVVVGSWRWPGALAWAAAAAAGVVWRRRHRRRDRSVHCSTVMRSVCMNHVQACSYHHLQASTIHRHQAFMARCCLKLEGQCSCQCYQA